MRFHRIPIMHLTPRKNCKQMGMARRPVSLHVWLQSQSGRTNLVWSLKNTKRIARI